MIMIRLIQAISTILLPLCSNKACGIDVLFAEHLLHASPEIHVLLSICFNAFIVHGFLPNPLTDTVLVPIVVSSRFIDASMYRDTCHAICIAIQFATIAIPAILQHSCVFYLNV